MKLPTFRNPFKKKTKFFVKPEHPVELAFVSDGMEYFRFKDPFNIPATRALCALDFYKEFEMGCDADYLKQFVEAIEKITSDAKKISIRDIVILTNQLKERIEYVKPKDLYLKLASVLYFDKNENPYAYDYAYGKEKMKRWNEDAKALDFFLLTHMSSLLPALNNYGLSSQTYFEVSEKINQHHLDTLSSLLSKIKLTNEAEKK